MSEALQGWFDEVGVWFSSEHLDIRGPGIEQDSDAEEPAEGCGVFAKVDLKPGDIIARIPKAACLSASTSPIAALLTAENLGGGLALTIAVMVEHAKGPASRWAKYFGSFPPQCDGVPILWPKQDWVLLEGTELEGAPAGELESMRDDYDEHVAPMLTRHAALSKLGITFQSFVRAATLVSSRAFFVDEDHGDALVPLADIFNHRSAIIRLAEGCSIEGYDNDDIMPDQQPQSRKRRRLADAAAEEEDDEEDDEEEAETPSGQYAQNEGNDHPLNIAICSIDDIFPDTNFPGGLEIVIQSPTAKGDEVWNTYGELANGSLLMKYGFATRENPHDIANLDVDLLTQVIATAATDDADDDSDAAGDSSDVKVERFHEILQHGDLFEEDSTIFEVDQDGSLPTALLFGLHYAVTEDGKMRRRYVVNVADAARNADPDLMLSCPATRDVLRRALCTRLAQLNVAKPSKRQQQLHLDFESGSPPLDVARALQKTHSDAYDRVSKRPARHFRGLNALAMRLGEGAALLAALEKLESL